MIKYIKNVLALKCPRCHKGKMFTHKWYQFKNITDMPEKCDVCGQRTHLEVGFYYGTGYVSYALTVALSVSTFVAGLVLFGLNWNDNSPIWWLVINSALILLLQPWFMRLSRVIWLSWFFHKDDKKHKTLEK